MWTWIAQLALGFLWNLVSAFLMNYSGTYGADQAPVKLIAGLVAEAEAKFPTDNDQKYDYVYKAALAALKAQGKPAKESLINAIIESAVQTFKASGLAGLLNLAGK